MRSFDRFLIIGGVLLALIMFSACAPKTTPHPPTAILNPPTEAPTELPVSEVQPPDSGQEAGDIATPEMPTEAVEEKAALPEVPIMEGAYKLQKMRGGENIIYTVDGEIAAVVKFYQEILPTVGWKEANSPDSTVGSIATMLRENDHKDRLTINMQENKKGGFVTITIAIVRGQ
jgi:hypothetical protein